MSETTAEQRQREALQLQVRTALGRAYAFVHSRSRLEQTLVRSVDDLKQAALEKIDGTEPTATFLRTRRSLTEKERIEEVRRGIHEAITVARSHPEFGSE